jgi:phosphoserine phosphatase
MAIKILFMDVEGTIFQKRFVDRPHDHGHSLWSRIYADLGPQALEEDNRLIELFERREITYTEWCELSMQIIRKHGLKRDHFETLIRNVPYNPGVEETLKTLKHKGVRLAMITGGFLEQARRAQLDLGIQHAYASTEIYWNENGTIEYWNILPSDYESKVDFVERLRKECGLTIEQCAFVGDGKNDIYIAKQVGTAFAYNAHPKLKEVATHTIEDFRDILKHI